MSILFVLPFVMVIAIVACCLAYNIVLQAIRSQANGNENDTQLLQDLHRSLSNLERRIENLESLVIDKAYDDDFNERLSS